MAKLHNKKPEETPIVMENIQFKRATIVSRDAPTRFLISVLDGSGEFEVREGGGVAVTGVVRLADERDAPLDLPPLAPVDAPAEDLLPLDNDDVYKELRLRGYNYSGVFRGIRSSDARGTVGSLAWEDNWISFIDTMLQFGIIGVSTRELYLPTRLQRVHVDPAAHLAAAAAGEVRVRMLRDIDVIRAGGVEMRGVKTSLAPRRANPQPAPKLEKYVFVPYDAARVGTEDGSRSRRDALVVALQLVLENAGSLRLRVAELALGRAPEALLLPAALHALAQEPQVRTEAALAAGPGQHGYADVLKDLDVKVPPSHSQLPSLSLHERRTV